MVFRERGRGVLAAFDRDGVEGRGFDPDDELVATSFAAAAAAAIFTAESMEGEKLQHAIEAAEHERRRWARELHDETLQELGALSTALDSAARQPGEDELRAAVGRAVEHAERCIGEVQTLINELRPAALDELGLEAALEALADRAEAAGGPRVECVLELDPAAAPARGRPTELETTVYRVVQEALNNAIKHSGATRVEIRVSAREGPLQISVGDDGAGFDSRRAGRGFGLIGMRERAALVGGRLMVESEPGRGTTVRAKFPVVRMGAEAVGGQRSAAAD
jgi:signal transduction histidine kinase